MLSPLATLLFIWAAIYSYVAVYNAVLHLRRPRQQEYLAFAGLALGLGIETVGSALAANGHDLTQGTFAIQILYVGGFVAVGFFMELGVALAGQRRPLLTLACYLWCGAAIVADAAGLVVGDLRDAPLATAFDSQLITPTLTAFGHLLVFVALGFSIWTIGFIASAARRRRDLRVLLGATGLTFIAALTESVLRLLQVPTISLSEHLGLLPILAVSYILVRRFVDAAGELGDRTDELRRSYGELRLTQEELVRKEQLAAVGELSAVIAHEVRNPLAIIKNAISSLRRPTLAAEDRGVLLQILDEEVDRLSRLVRDLLAYARPVTPQARPIELEEVIDMAIIDVLAAHGAADRVNVMVQLADCPQIQGDPDLLHQAVANVIDNAVCATPRDGSISVRYQNTRLGGDSAVTLFFTDTGQGMSAKTRAKATDPFFTSRPAGTGLGLAIVDRVVKNHGGRVSIESQLGVGTTVKITLPHVRRTSLPPGETLP